MPILPELISFLRRPAITAARVPMTVSAWSDLSKLLGISLVLALISVTVAGGLYSALSGDGKGRAAHLPLCLLGQRAHLCAYSYEQLCGGRVSAFSNLARHSAIHYRRDIRLCAYALWPSASDWLSCRL